MKSTSPVQTSQQTIRLNSRDGTFRVRIAEPDDPQKTVIIVGGLMEHYTPLAAPVIEEWAKSGYRAVAIGVPYEKHLTDVRDSAALISEVIRATQVALNLTSATLVLHSGATLVMADKQFHSDDFNDIVLWSGMGIHRTDKHSLNPLFSAWRLTNHIVGLMLESLSDRQLIIQVFGGSFALLRNLNHMPGVLRIFYHHNIRRTLPPLTSKIIVFHGRHDRVFPIDEVDAKWLKNQPLRSFLFADRHWNHAGLHSGRAVEQSREIINRLQA